MSAPEPGGAVWRLRTRPEDFVVEEEPLYEASGEGGHTFLWVEKRGRTTEQVARGLAREAGLRPRDVGYAGRKDRHAVTRQWFSLEGLDPERALAFELEDARVLEARRHPHKLRTGQLRANRFEIVLRSESPPPLDALAARVATLVERGLPNHFGDQRFGRDGDNAAQARSLLEGGRPPRDRRAARFLISALQAELFNAVLDERLEDYDGVRLGDLARVEESGGLFWVDDLAREAPRAAAFEISATGPIFGRKMRAPREEVARLEQGVLERFGLPQPASWELPRGVRASGTRRPLRVRPLDLVIVPLDPLAATGATDGRRTGVDGDGHSGPANALRVACRLPPGSYVTVLLESLLGPGRLVDASRGGASPDAARDAGVP